MQIDVLSLVPKKWDIEEVGNGLIKLSYKTGGKGDHNRKSVTLPKKIDVTEDFVSGMAMYLGDGKLAKDGHLGYASKDIDIMQHMLLFFENMNQHATDISFYINYRDHLDLNKWSNSLGIPKDKIKTYKRERTRHPAMTIQLSSVILRKLFGCVVDEFLKVDLVNNRKLRRAFLRGLFAAEGGVSVQRTEKPVPYINFVSLSFSSDEQWLIKLCCRALKKEGVRTRIYKRKNQHSVDIITSNWSNFWKLWKIGIFYLCARKKRVFLDTAKVLRVKCLIEESLRRKLFSGSGLRQRSLAKKLGTYQASVCRMIQGKFWPTIEQIFILSNLSKISLFEIRRSLLDVRIGNMISVNDREFFDFMVKLKSI